MKIVKQRISMEIVRAGTCGCPFASQSSMFGGSWAQALSEQ